MLLKHPPRHTASAFFRILILESTSPPLILSFYIDSELLSTTRFHTITMTLSSAPCTKSVSFSQKVKAKTTTHLNNFTPKEKKSYWYTSNEMRGIHGDIKVTVNLMEMEMDLSSSEEFCTRGLESRPIVGARRRSERRERAWRALSMEQECQQKHGVYDPQALAAVYSAEVEECAVSALVMGLLYERQEEGCHSGSSSDGSSALGGKKYDPAGASATSIMMGGRFQHTVVLQRPHHRHLTTHAA